MVAPLLPILGRLLATTATRAAASQAAASLTTRAGTQALTGRATQSVARIFADGDQRRRRPTITSPDGKAQSATGRLTAAWSGLAERLRGVNQGMSDLSKGIGGPVKELQSFTSGLQRAPRALGEWAKSLLETREPLRRWSADLDAAFARSEMAGIRRDVRSAARTGGATADLADSYSAFEDAVQPLADEFSNVGTTVTARLTDLGTLLARFVGQITPVMERLNRALGVHEREATAPAAIEHATQRIGELPSMLRSLDRNPRS